LDTGCGSGSSAAGRSGAGRFPGKRPGRGGIGPEPGTADYTGAMFTGIVVGMGHILEKQPREGGIRLRVDAREVEGIRDCGIGDSVAVSGCCLTVVEREGPVLGFDVIPESLARTSLGSRGVGDPVNLELPLRPFDRMGGHFVQGHVDARGVMLARDEHGDDVVLTFGLPEALRGHVVEKGSIAIDGVSLTVAGVGPDSFRVALIPHTLAITTLGTLRPGDPVNLEGDILAKYVAAMMEGRR